MKNLKKTLVNNKLIHYTILPIYRFFKWILRTPNDYRKYVSLKKKIYSFRGQKRIYYFGKPVHANLGDLAQWVCITKWLRKHFDDWNIIEIETEEVVRTHFSIIKVIKKEYKNEDFIIFQSGYTTTDLGGDADDMHCKVIKMMPEAKMLMMPQTIFFRSIKRQERTSRIYSLASNLLFLARDKVSYEMALGMFSNIKVELFPDIVTSLIGIKKYQSSRDGLLFCCRDDDEKYYNDNEINELALRCEKICNISMTDTTKYINMKSIIANPQKYIEDEIEKYSHFKCVITDRYHGTIFSLIAGTPVIIIRTTDHKVTTGADWFNGVYDDYVFVAKDLNEAFLLAKKVLNTNLDYDLEPYFDKNFYNKLAFNFKNMLK